MEQKKTAGLIVTAGSRKNGQSFEPLMKLGDITIVKRLVLTFQQAGISPIVLITGNQAEDIEHDLADYGVVFLKNERYEQTQMLDSAKIGFAYLFDKCEQVIFTKVDVPLFTKETVQKIMKAKGSAVTPCYQGKAGHPLCIAKELIPDILAYGGNDGMRGFLHSIQKKRIFIEVDDKGIIYDADQIENSGQLVAKHSEQMIHPYIKISIEKEQLFFNSRAKLLLMLIEDTHSVKGACSKMAISYSKAWNLLNGMEEQLGFPVVERQHGGRDGGGTQLSKEGKEFLERYSHFEESVRHYAAKEFETLFLKNQ